jgi:hypothetical protein
VFGKEFQARYSFWYENDLTLCEVLVIPPDGSPKPSPLAKGMVTRYPNDKPNRLLARKLAFARAVQNFSRENRTTLWKHFRENCRQP